VLWVVVYLHLQQEFEGEKQEKTDKNGKGDYHL
jgi:hypothetical protein